jgi:protein SCO1/2
VSDAGPLAAEADGRTPFWRRRWKVLVALNLVAAALLSAAAWNLAKHLSSPQLRGAILTPPVHAYTFQLPDQNGRMVSLEDFRGKVVALTFLYTHCPDVCPLTADKLHQTYLRLGETAKTVAFVAISVDPHGDTPAAVQGFLAGHHVEKELVYLVGSFAQLGPVWANYYVGSDAKEVNPAAVAASTPTPQQVGHTAIVYIIDPKGEIRAFLPGNFDPKDLETNLRLLVSGAVR